MAINRPNKPKEVTAESAIKAFQECFRRMTMKNGKRPTVRQKKLMTQWNLNCDNWLVVKDTSTEMVIVHRDTDKIRTIEK